MVQRMPRRLWVRRGRNLADFTMGFLATTIEYLFLAMISCFGYLAHKIGQAVQGYRARVNRKAVSEATRARTLSATVSSEKTETARDAVEVLVSLGLPRQASERRVARIVDMHGILPIEEFLRKALG